MSSIVRTGKVMIHDHAGVNAWDLNIHATRLSCAIANYQRRLPCLFREQPINACIVPDAVFKSWFASESDAYCPPEARISVIPFACYGIVDDMIKFPASLLSLDAPQGWEWEGVSHEVLHAGSRRILDRGIKCGIAFCNIDGKVDSTDKYFNEGITEHIRMNLGGAVVMNRYYPVAMAISDIAKRVGEDAVLSAYFGKDIDPFINAVERAFGVGSYSAIKELSRSVAKGHIEADRLSRILRG